jgi:dihydropteroate synthase
MTLHHARGALELDRCLVMGIVNRTPDSFFDGGRMDLDGSVAHAHRLIEEGADILDLGAIKAGPGAEVAPEEEAARLLPLVEALGEAGAPLSVETARPKIAEQALGAGAAIINDVSGLADPGLADVCSALGAALILMHNGGQIRGRPRSPTYDDVVRAVIEEWHRLARIANDHGVPDDRIVVDAGLDFGKNTLHSLELVRRLDEQVAEPWPVLVAPSRKDVVGETLDLPLDQRLEGTLALVALSVAGGASIVRVHDVQAAVRTVRMVEAVSGTGKPVAPVRGLWD